MTQFSLSISYLTVFSFYELRHWLAMLSYVYLKSFNLYISLLAVTPNKISSRKTLNVVRELYNQNLRRKRDRITAVCGLRWLSSWLDSSSIENSFAPFSPYRTDLNLLDIFSAIEIISNHFYMLDLMIFESSRVWWAFPHLRQVRHVDRVELEILSSSFKDKLP